MNNAINYLKSIMNKTNPKQIVMNMATNGNPMLKNLIDMANKGDKKGVENFARNLYKEQGRDFDSEFSDFMSNFR